MSYCSRSCRRRFTVNGYLCTLGVNLDTAVRFADPDFLLGYKISAIWRCFTLIFAFNISIVRRISRPVCLTYWPRNYTTRVDPTSIILTKFEDPTPIRSWVLSDNVSHWLPLKKRTRPLRMRQITWRVSRGSKTITFLESPTPICLFTMQLILGYDDD